MTYYDILQITKTASSDTIHRAYRILVKKYHPDIYKGNTDEANLKMSAINEAYAVLSDSAKRKEYDDYLNSYRENTINRPETTRTNPDISMEYNPKYEGKESDSSGCSGCLGKVFGVLFYAVIIVLIFRACSGKDDTTSVDIDNRVSSCEQLETTEQNKINNELQKQAPVNNYLSDKAQSAEKLFFHKHYTDLGTVEIHFFNERQRVLEYMVTIATNKDVFDDGCFVAYENKFFGDDYYYSTTSQTNCYYIGKLKNNRPHGFGAVIGFSNGSGTYDFSGEVLFYYVGNFHNGMKDGFGVEFNADECDITPAAQHIANLNLVSDENGESLCRYLFNHVKYEGFWNNNKYDGKGNEFYFPLYDGIYYFHEKIHEPIKGYIYGNAYPNVTKGEWKDGKLTGDVSIYKLNHKDYIGEMKKGKCDGKGTSFYSNNQIKYDGRWKDGKPHGNGSYYDISGNLIYSGRWNNGDYAH